MDREIGYEEDVRNFVKEAVAVESAWKEQSDENKVKVTSVPSIPLSSCDYRAMGWRPSRTYFRGHCDRCHATASVRRTSVSAGCRHNGDGYGSDLYYCTTCGLFDWDSYDEA